MTQTCTQKRYRQYHHDNTAPRFRDLPPRFKRQKSSTSKAESETVLENQENKDLQVQSQPLSSLNLLSDTDSNSTMKQPMSQMFKQNVPLNEPALSVNTKLYSNPPFQVVDQYGRGYLCYQECGTPPISPYGIVNKRHGVDAQPNGHHLSPYSENVRAISRPTSSEAMSPCLEMAKVANPQVKKCEMVTSQHHTRQMSASPVDSHSQSPVQCVDYSDPDLRTMEMLRELERVADQKEKEDQERERKEREESGELKDNNDRKNYVSHHLRMLMCAVDRYTADIDDQPSNPDSDFASSKVASWQAKESRNQPPVRNSKPKEYPSTFCSQDTSDSKIQANRSNQNWSHANNNHFSQFTPYPNQQWSHMQQQNPAFGTRQTMGHQIPHSHVILPLASTQGAMIPVTPPLMHHMLTPPPSRTSSPHPSPCLQKSAPVTPQGSFFPKQPKHQSQLVAKALVFGSENELKPQDSLAHIIAPVSSSNCSGQGYGGWDIWSGPSIFDINSNVNVQKERKPLYNR